MKFMFQICHYMLGFTFRILIMILNQSRVRETAQRLNQVKMGRHHCPEQAKQEVLWPRAQWHQLEMSMPKNCPDKHLHEDTALEKEGPQQMGPNTIQAQGGEEYKSGTTARADCTDPFHF